MNNQKSQQAIETAQNLTFGVELEVIFSGSSQTIANAITASGIRCENQSYNHNTVPFWKVVSDASVSCGWEVVSPILTLDRLSEVKTVCEVLNQVGAGVNITTGMHVHVGVQTFFSEKQIKNILKRAVRYESAMDTLVPPSRRDSRWAKGFSSKTIIGINEKINIIDQARNLQTAYESICYNGRYHKLNLNSYWRQGTVEFRQHSGSTDPEKVTKWIEFCTSFVLRGAFGPEIKSIRNLSDSVKERSKMLSGQFGKSATVNNPEAITFYRKRSKQLAA